jgi:hypothetical protein
LLDAARSTSGRQTTSVIAAARGELSVRQQTGTVGAEQVGSNVAVVVKGRLPARWHAPLLGEAVERLVVLFGEPLGELEILGASLTGRDGEPGAERAHVLVIELIPRPKIIRDPADEVIADALCRSRSKCTGALRMQL